MKQKQQAWILQTSFAMGSPLIVDSWSGYLAGYELNNMNWPNIIFLKLLTAFMVAHWTSAKISAINTWKRAPYYIPLLRDT